MDNFNTMPTGTPEERRLVQLKKDAGRNIDALRGRVSSKWRDDAIRAIDYAQSIPTLTRLYAGWQQEIENKRKPDLTLPDLTRKPQVTQISKAA